MYNRITFSGWGHCAISSPYYLGKLSPLSGEDCETTFFRGKSSLSIARTIQRGQKWRWSFESFSPIHPTNAFLHLSLTRGRIIRLSVSPGAFLLGNREMKSPVSLSLPLHIPCLLHVSFWPPPPPLPPLAPYTRPFFSLAILVRSCTYEYERVSAYYILYVYGPCPTYSRAFLFNIGVLIRKMKNRENARTSQFLQIKN